MKQDKKINILMVGPGRTNRGGIPTVVNSYFEFGLDEKCNIKYIETMRNGSKIRKLAVAFLALVKFCFCVNRYDIVHIHMAAHASYYRKVWFIKIAKLFNKKIVIHQHSADFHEFYFNECSDTTRKSIIRNFSLIDSLIVLSEEWADFFSDNICEKDIIRVVHNSVAVPEYKKTDYENKNILFLGRLGKRKGVYDLLKSVPRLLESFPDAMLYLAGDGDIDGCRQIAKEKDFIDNIKFLGWINTETKQEYLKKCSVFILPSYNEGMPMSLLEAMSYGLACITTNVGGIPQVIVDGENGLLTKPGNISYLKELLTKLVNDSKLKKNLGENARKTIQTKFNISVNIRNVYNIYQEILNKKGKKSYE